MRKNLLKAIFMTLDLRGAYLNVPIFPEHQAFLRFAVVTPGRDSPQGTPFWASGQSKDLYEDPSRGSSLSPSPRDSVNTLPELPAHFRSISRCGNRHSKGYFCPAKARLAGE